MRLQSVARRLGGVLLLGLAPVYLGACVARAPSGAQCRFNADCAEGLLCAASTCRAECRTDRDCTNGWLCGPAGQPALRVCVPPGSPWLCAYPSDCPATQSCARDGLCRPQCRTDRDCPANTPAATCALPEGVCSAATTLPTTRADAAADAAPQDAPDAGAPDVAADVALDAAADAPALDAAAEASADASLEAAADAPPDGTSQDSAADAPALDAAAEASLDAAAPESSVDAPAESSPDATDAATTEPALDGAPWSCPGALTRCDLACVDLQRDTNHCGRCFNRCPSPAGGTVACAAGVCLMSCASGLTDCGGACVDTSTDSYHCGACGARCRAGCSAGACVDPLAIELAGDTVFARMSDSTWRAWGILNWASTGFPSASTANYPPVTVPALAPYGRLLLREGIFNANTAWVLEGTGTRRALGIGANNGGLGDGATANRSALTPVANVTDVLEVVGGPAQVCVRYDSAQRLAACWGRNAEGQLGTGTTAGISNAPDPAQPVGGAASPLLGVVSLAAGAEFGCAALADNSARCWGRNGAEGVLGAGAALGTGVFPSPQTVLLSNVASVRAGSRFACALTTAGEVYCWGDNSSGQLGDGTTMNRSTPTRALGLSGVTGLSLADYAACAVTAAHDVFCWGSNFIGRLGVGDGAPRTTPTQVRLASGAPLAATSVRIGGSYACALTFAAAPSRPDVYCWGNNDSGQLGTVGGRRPSPDQPVLWDR